MPYRTEIRLSRVARNLTKGFPARFLAWKCRQYGKALFLTNEAYTSKTVSWTGEIIPNLGGRKVVRDRSGREMDRDINGARGNFLRALADTPALHVSVQEFVGDRL